MTGNSSTLHFIFFRDQVELLKQLLSQFRRLLFSPAMASILPCLLQGYGTTISPMP